MSTSTTRINLYEFGLRIESQLVGPLAPNFRPPSWPPPKNWPVVVDANGECVSAYGDSVWHLDLWARKAMRLDFGDGSDGSSSDPIDSVNADLLRLVTALWLWGPFAVYSCTTLKSKFSSIRRIFAFCSRQGIRASDLMRFPLLVDKLPTLIGGIKNIVDGFFNCISDLYEQRELLGFTLLDREGLRHLAKALPEFKDSAQRAYIPPRIWSYQVTHLKRCLDDYLKHQEQIEDCYQFCLEAYAHNSGTIKDAISVGLPAPHYGPFDTESYCVKKNPGLKFYGPFELTAAFFGIHELLERWSGPLNDKTARSGIHRLTDYLNLVSYAGLAYILNFSLMRINEAWGLRTDCLMVERDSKFGDMYILRGETTKTQKDSDARWPTSPSVKVAVEAMAHMAHLRLRCTSAHQSFSNFDEDINNPYLIGRAYEPWMTVKENNFKVRPHCRSYIVGLLTYPLLFDVDTLRIRSDDLALARLITPSIDTDKFKVGEVWPFSWHQLRRTGSVNMQSSGLVSDFSLQYLLKHQTLSQSLYYGQNHSKLLLNQAARTTYLKAMYEVVGHELNRLADQRFVSPHGDKRKAEVLRLITPKDAKKLAKAAEKGEVTPPRAIILGYCMYREICPWGGIDSIAHCGGGDSDSPCLHVLYDVKKIHIVKELDGWLDQQLQEAPSGSPLRQSLEYQKHSAKNYLDVCTTKL